MRLPDSHACPYPTLVAVVYSRIFRFVTFFTLANLTAE
jgi:hypothetical protein